MDDRTFRIVVTSAAIGLISATYGTLRERCASRGGILACAAQYLRQYVARLWGEAGRGRR